tara:strand:+ start:4729 stop:6105 length:1377 start_codon:yes stop_codon:yes gene_type:complete
LFFKNYTKEFSYNLKLSLPIILGLLGHTLVGMIDNIMVGKLDPTNLAAVSLGNSFIFIAMSIGIGFSAAITPVVAEAHSKNNNSDLKKSFVNGFFMCLFLGCSLFVAILLFKPMLYLLDQPKNVIELAIPYLHIVAFSLIPLLMFQALKQFSDGLSLTAYSMYATIISNIVNIIVNYILIFGKFGFPQMGIVGAAIGTLVSRIIMLIFLYQILYHRKIIKNYLSDIFNFVVNKIMIKKIISLGLPTSLQMLFEVGIFTSAIWLSGLLGENTQSANQIVLNISSMTFMIASGLGVSASIRSGNQKGLNNYIEQRRISLSILFLGILFASIFSIIIFFLRDALPYIYIDITDSSNYYKNLEIVNKASVLFIIVSLFQLFDSAQVIILGALRGMQDVVIPTLIVFVAYWVIGFPISYYFGDISQFQEVGIWAGLLSGLFFSSLFLYLRFIYLSNNLIKDAK